MNKDLKKYIRVLAEKFGHRVRFQKDVMIVENEINHIKLWEKDKYGVDISYNLNENCLDTLKVDINDSYDIIIQLLSRKKQSQKLKIKTGFLLIIEEWLKEEGDFAKKRLEELQRDLEFKDVESRQLGGNRYEAEYYKGVLILTDDLGWAKSNVISIETE